MKRILLTLITLFLAFIIIHDIKRGTLTLQSSAKPVLQEKEQPLQAEVEKKETNPSDAPYFLIEVEPGATVISITEQLYDGPIPVSIEQLVSDFSRLNPDVSPNSIQIGKVYKFPNYTDKSN